MRQRVMIAIALACNPKLMIADEPTTALDVTIQAQILELMKNLSRKLNIALIIITHNLGVVARYADRVIVMYAARVAEQGPADAVFHRPRHPYTLGLLRSVPRLDRPRGSKLETIEGLPPNLANSSTGCRFAPRCPYRIAVCDQEPPLFHRHRRAFALSPASRDRGRQDHMGGRRRRCYGRHCQEHDAGAVGPQPDQVLLRQRWLARHGRHSARSARRFVRHLSRRDARAGRRIGCGKTTIGRLILRLEEPTAGEIHFEGISLSTASPAQLRPCAARSR